MTAYDMRISDWSSDVCSSDLGEVVADEGNRIGKGGPSVSRERQPSSIEHVFLRWLRERGFPIDRRSGKDGGYGFSLVYGLKDRKKHTSDIQSLMRNSYAVFCLKKKTPNTDHHHTVQHITTYSQKIYNIA